MTRDPLQYIDIICYINLSHREDRKKNILLQLNRLAIPKEKVIHIEAVQDLMNGHRGCAYSHILALEEAEKRGASVLIVEDDCEFIANPSEIEALCDYFFSTLGNNWDVFMLGGALKNTNRQDSMQFIESYSRIAHMHTVYIKIIYQKWFHFLKLV